MSVAAYSEAEIEAAALRPSLEMERLGPSYRVTISPPGAVFLFRDVRTDRELTADLAVRVRGRHLFRSTVTLSLTGRDRLAKVASGLDGRTDGGVWRAAAHAAAEAVMEAEEQLGAPIDLRSASLELPAGGLYVAEPMWPTGSMVLVSPGEAGKSTIARAIAVSKASGRQIIPGVAPIGAPCPVLYVAAEDPVAHWHARSVEAICRGAGIERADLPEPVELFDARGRPLHRIARSIAERAADFGAVILDSQQALLSQLDASGGVRDRDSLFWHAVDQLTPPTFIVAHPNRADSRDWQRADGRIAGSEVNRDRARMAWSVAWRDEQATIGQTVRRYTLHNTKRNHGPREAPIGFTATWLLGVNADPGVLRFAAAEPLAPTSAEPGLPKAITETLEAYRRGATTVPELCVAIPGLTVEAAKKRLQRIAPYLGDDE